MPLYKTTPKGRVKMTKDEEAAFKADQQALQATASAAAQRASAQDALRANDRVALRCVKAGVPYPDAWKDYDQALRAVIDGGGEMPARPGYPEGT